MGVVRASATQYESVIYSGDLADSVLNETTICCCEAENQWPVALIPIPYRESITRSIVVKRFNN